jgi:ribonuclease R
LESKYLAIVQIEGAELWLHDAIDEARPRARLDETRADVASGDVVVASDVDGRGRIIERLARAGTPRSELYGIFIRNGCSPIFPEAVREEVVGFEDATGIDDPQLVDLTHLPFVTIDGATSLDLDQAAYVEADEHGWVVYYALADASYYVRPTSALWEEASKRAASYYLPGVMVPMLPRELSEGLVSLNAQVERRCLVIRSRLNSDGSLRQDGNSRIGPSDAFRARIRSRAKLSFEQVHTFYQGDDQAIADAKVAQSLQNLRAVGQARQELAEERNVVRYRRVELDVKVRGSEHRRFVAAEAIRHPVEGYNEQLSLLCNSEGARLLKEASKNPLVEPIYRVHPPPETARLARLRELTQALARAHALPQRWVWQSGQQLADYLEQLPTQPAGIAKAINRQAVMVNVASNYQSLPDRHYGVGAEVYARFSAPMRELVGIFLHRELLQALEADASDDKALRDLVIERANEAKRLQKRITNEGNLLVLDQIFEEQRALPRHERGLPATVVGMTRSKVYVIFERYPIDAKIHVRDLRNSLGGKVQVDDDGCQLLREGARICRMGDEVSVIVESHDEKRRHWALSISV